MSYYGLVYWNELNTWDADKATDYYGPIMDWTLRKLYAEKAECPVLLAHGGQPKQVAFLRADSHVILY